MMELVNNFMFANVLRVYVRRAQHEFINNRKLSARLHKHAVISNYFMENRKKLYRVTLRGMTYNSTGVAYGSSYVIAENSDEAYKKVRKFLDENDLGFTKYRELDKVELIADSYRYTDVGCLLHL